MTAVQYLLGAIIGALVGALIGWRGRCQSGRCPLTSNPYVGGLYGAILGTLIAGAVACTSNVTVTESPEGSETSVMAETQKNTIVKLGDAREFKRTVLQAAGPVIVDAWAPWCGPCQVQGPILEEFAERHGDEIKVVKINIDDHPELSKRLRIRAIPTLLVFEDGREKRRLVGVHSFEDLKQALAL